MGLGKTLQAIEVMKLTKLKTIIVCPATLRDTWAAEIEKFSEIKPTIYNSRKKVDDYQALIVSYNMLDKVKTHFRKAKLVVADEVHYLKNLDAKRTATFHSYVRDFTPDRFLGLSGTAIKNRVPEFYSLLALCSYNPRSTSGINIFKEYSYYKFCNHFSYRRTFFVNNRQVVKYEGHKNVPELKKLLRCKYIRRKASDVLDLPPITRKDIIANSSYMDTDLLESWTQGKPFATVKKESAFMKVKFTINYCKELLDQGESPIIVFTDHKESCEDLAKYLGGEYIHGDISMEARAKIVKRFKAGELRVLVATFGTMSEGYTLTEASNIVMNDLPWTPTTIAQAERRINRIGQDKHCTIHRIFYGKVDIKIGRELDKKLKTLRKVL
jgi:SNF2 family DNA or RNA helicase